MLCNFRIPAVLMAKGALKTGHFLGNEHLVKGRLHNNFLLETPRQSPLCQISPEPRFKVPGGSVTSQDLTTVAIDREATAPASVAPYSHSPFSKRNFSKVAKRNVNDRKKINDLLC